MAQSLKDSGFPRILSLPKSGSPGGSAVLCHVCTKHQLLVLVDIGLFAYHTAVSYICIHWLYPMPIFSNQLISAFPDKTSPRLKEP